MTELNTTITAVTVYPDRARVTRSGTAELEPGLHRLEVAYLPPVVDPDSVRASARGTARARLLGVSVRREYFTEAPAARARELEKEIELLESKLGYLDANDAAYRKEMGAMESILAQGEPFAKGLAFGKMTGDDLMGLLDAYRERAGDISSELTAGDILKQRLKRKKQKLEQELEELHSARERVRHIAVVEVEVLQAGSLTVELTAVVSEAGWEPLYDLRLSEDGETPTLEVGYLAQVTQRTGENWENVALTLSTARPALAETLPELDPWYLSPIRAFTAPSSPKMMMRMMAAPPPAPAAEEQAVEKEAPEVEAEIAVATVETTGAAVTYTVPGETTIPADGESHKVTVARFDLTPKMDYVTVPKLVEAAYRRATVANESPYTLLPGQANIFAGEEFVGATELELTAPGGEVELYLGTDDRLRVKRELTRREVDKKLLRDRRRLRYGYEIELENFLPTTASVTVQDQIPVPRHEEIKVRLESTDPRPKEQSDLNLLEWELVLSPGEKRTVRFEFTVEHPRDMSVTGLP